jgi:TPP-dependent pyruvate/acetoin dehydrogenase alpha subunit
MDYETIYRSMYQIRRVEEEIARIYPSDKIKSPVHLSIGQEAVSVGVCQALGLNDVVFGTYRGHALYLAKGGDLPAMIAELYGKVDGCARGKGGSMHLIDVEHGVMGMSAVVSTTIPEAVGYAYAMKVRKADTVVASFFGDGAVEEGAFHESMNFASLKKVPMLFICENNKYAIHASVETRQRLDNICERARSYGMVAEKIEKNDIIQITEQVGEAVAEIRAGKSGPRFFECMTYRWKEHVGPYDDFHMGYRTEEEAQAWIDDDQLVRVGEYLDEALQQQVHREVEAEIQAAFEFAENSKFPDTSELYEHVFKGS